MIHEWRVNATHATLLGRVRAGHRRCRPRGQISSLAQIFLVSDSYRPPRSRRGHRTSRDLTYRAMTSRETLVLGVFLAFSSFFFCTSSVDASMRESRVVEYHTLSSHDNNTDGATDSLSPSTLAEWWNFHALLSARRSQERTLSSALCYNFNPSSSIVIVGLARNGNQPMPCAAEPGEIIL